LHLSIPERRQGSNSNSAAHGCGNFEQTAPDVNEPAA
jgi:hypothetical protein